MTADREHPDWNELAALVDSGSGQARPELLEHLAACPACLAAWSAAVEHRDRELAAATPPRSRVVPGRRRIPGRQVAWGAGGLAAAALLLFLVLPRGSTGPVPYGPEDRLLHRLSGLSHTGLVYPRVVELAPAPPADYRAGATNGAAIDLTPWVERFAADAGDSEAAFWLAAGHISRGQLDMAEDVLRRALRRSPRSLELRHLVAIVAYQRSDLHGAIRELRSILRDDPGQALAQFNLAVIALEVGEPAGMHQMLEPLARDPTRPALQARAHQLLQQVDP